MRIGIVFFLAIIFSGCSTTSSTFSELFPEKEKSRVVRSNEADRYPVDVKGKLSDPSGRLDRMTLSAEQREIIATTFNGKPSGRYALDRDLNGRANHIVAISPATSGQAGGKTVWCREFSISRQEPKGSIRGLACHKGGNLWQIK